jgi:hypothetical protein
VRSYGRRVLFRRTKAQWRDKELRQRCSEEMKALWRDPECRAKMVDAARKREA